MKSRNLEHECEIDLEILGKRIGGEGRDLLEDAPWGRFRRILWCYIGQSPKDIPTATEYWLCKFNWKFLEFFLALLENSVLENLSLVSDKFHRSEPGCGSENSETGHKIHKKHAYGGPKNQR
jgi:hypothetical protein